MKTFLSNVSSHHCQCLKATRTAAALGRHNNTTLRGRNSSSAIASSTNRDEDRSALKSLAMGDVHAYWLLDKDVQAPSKSQNHTFHEELEKRYLSEEDRAMLRVARDPQTRRQRLLSRVVLRSVLSSYLTGIEEKDLRFGIEPGGKPYLKDQDILWRNAFAPSQTLHFNITHSSNILGLCVSSSPVGVDVEQLSRKTNNSILKIANRRFSPKEVRSLEEMPDNDGQRTKAFLHLWTLKESYLKATGLGISSNIGLKRCIFDVTGPHGDADCKIGRIRMLSPKEDATHYHFGLYSPTADTLSAICWKKKSYPKEVVSYDSSKPKLKVFVCDDVDIYLDNKGIYPMMEDAHLLAGTSDLLVA